MKDGQTEGDNREYYESGRVFAKAVFKDGKTHDLKFYYDEPSPYLIFLGAGSAAFVFAFILTYVLLIYLYKKPKG